MSLRLSNAVTAIVMATLSLALADAGALAGPLDKGLYAGAFGSISGPDSEFDYAGGTDAATYDTGAGGGLFVGYAFGNGFRAEGEFAMRQSDIANIDTSIASPDSGETRVDSLFANLIYDFDLGMPVTPYAGVGVGVAHVSHGLVTTVAADSVHDDYYTAAGQAIIGASFDIDPKWRAFVDYRLMLSGAGDTTTSTGTPVESRTSLQSINIGFSRLF